jgi:hypothetical protein
VSIAEGANNALRYRNAELCSLRNSLFRIGMVCELFPLSPKNFFMAEINVQTKKQSSSSWLWIIIVLAIVAAVAYFLMRNNDTVENKVENATSQAMIVEKNNLLVYS